MRLFFFLSILLTSCASLRTWPSLSSQLLNHYNDHVVTQSLLDEGRVVLMSKIVRATPELIALQKQRAPNFEVRVGESEDVWIVAVTIRGREPTDLSDLKVFKNGQTERSAQASLTEIVNQDVVETLYPFAWPYHRVFVARFSSTQAPRSLTVSGPTGTLDFDLVAVR